MAQPDQEIRKLLEQRLATMTAVPAIAWQNVPFTPPTNAPWLRPTLAPADQLDTDILGNGTSKVTDVGLFLIDVFAPEGKGVAVAEALVAAIRQHFRRGVPLAGSTVAVRLESNIAGPAQQGTPEEPGFFIPVSIRYRVTYTAS